MKVLRAGDRRLPPLVCIHPVTGRSGVYAGLAAALAWPGRVVGIDAPAPVEPGPSLHELAERYAAELDAAQPALLLGWAVGGVIAAELAAVIAARGGRVGFVGVLDARAPGPEMRQRPADRDTLARYFVSHAALTRELAPLPPPASSSPAELLATLRALGDPAADEAEVEHRLATLVMLTRALFRHEPQRVPVTLHLFEAMAALPTHPKPPTLGWDPLAPHVEHVPVAGTHFDLLAPRHTAALAQAIDRYLPGG